MIKTSYCSNWDDSYSLSFFWFITVDEKIEHFKQEQYTCKPKFTSLNVSGHGPVLPLNPSRTSPMVRIPVFGLTPTLSL